MADHDARLWAQMLAHLRTHHPAICRQWFEDIVPLGLSGGILRLKVTPTLHRVYLRNECAGPFNDAARAVTGRLVSVRFVGDADEPEEDYSRGLTARPRNGNAGETVSSRGPRFGEVTINPDNSFGNFVIGPEKAKNVFLLMDGKFNRERYEQQELAAGIVHPPKVGAGKK